MTNVTNVNIEAELKAQLLAEAKNPNGFVRTTKEWAEHYPGLKIKQIAHTLRLAGFKQRDGDKCWDDREPEAAKTDGPVEGAKPEKAPKAPKVAKEPKTPKPAKAPKKPLVEKPADTAPEENKKPVEYCTNCQALEIKIEELAYEIETLKLKQQELEQQQEVIESFKQKPQERIAAAMAHLMETPGDVDITGIDVSTGSGSQISNYSITAKFMIRINK